MNAEDIRLTGLPVFQALHDQWWSARAKKVGKSQLAFGRDWETLLTEAGLTTSDLRREADRDARTLQSAGWIELKSVRRRSLLIERVWVPLEKEQALAVLFGDPWELDECEPSSVDWVPELKFLTEKRPSVPLADCLRINQFLQQSHPVGPRVPIKERSLEIFGDEKRLDALRATTLFREDRMTLERLGCLVVPEPLGWMRGPTPNGKVLILENAATFHSFAAWNQQAARFSAVIYGGGHRVIDGVGFLAHLASEVGEISQVFYFGDLDPEGLRIPVLANEKAKKLGLPSVEPLEDAYGFLLSLPDSCRAPMEDNLREAPVDWLPKYEAEVRQLFLSSHRIAQEWLGAKTLLGNWAPSLPQESLHLSPHHKMETGYL